MPPNNPYSSMGHKSHSLALILTIVVLVLALIGSIGFGAWAYSSQQDYKNNVDQKVLEAVGQAQEKTAQTKDAEFAEKEKIPLKHYNGPGAYGSIDISYPRTWSAYVDENSKSSNAVVSGYFSPKFVPGISNPKNIFALRLEVVSAAYDDVLKSFESNIQAGKVKVSAFSLPRVKTAPGSRLTGEIQPDKQGSMIVVPLRDKTLKVWTESPEFFNDFNKNILPNLTFVP